MLMELDKGALSVTPIRMAPRILIVDDDPHIRDVVRIALKGAEFETREAENGQVALTHFGREPFDLVVLDIGMPKMDGFECCKAIRANSNVPVLFLTAQEDEVDRVLGFQLGADDFVPKPFSPRELVLRIKAILARGKPAPSAPLQHGDLTLRPDAHECDIGGQPLQLTAREFALLEMMMRAPARVFDRNQLITGIYGANSTLSGRTVDSHLRHLRAKAAALGCEDLVTTIHSIGLKLGSCRL
ncbi:MAG: response regulator transcription factor [Silicimonas sp.]|nr:response regulator transcription factor [Silicimonas sp.]